ncbi:MAG: NYN domain-containing protein [Planctomycetes bacterium]|nr:NYN domain-containing protein [Planctomycetota bacterium]
MIDASELKLAVFIDFENIIRGIEQPKQDQFSITIIMDRLREKGKILVKKAYADWTRFTRHRHDLNENAVEMLELPSKGGASKNLADIKLVVDAFETVFSKPFIDAYAIVSGDSDFTPLVSKLREFNKQVIGIGMKGSTSELLADNCDEFIYYETLEKIKSQRTVGKDDLWGLLKESVFALQRENVAPILSSRVKETMIRKHTTFNEVELGYKTFSRFLEAAQAKNVIRIQKEPRSNTYQILEVVE